ncbi:YhcU family protein [Bacillus andreraoultii]|uniref:YhcU family protein n=1 Tax=Bacillus andreraoultii TaxID=1499685 RepID=UPI00053BB0B9|nr:YhcU family protein [Bacillus andreraoultii]
MKIVYASTSEQEKKINSLVEYFYSTILPKYFSDKDINQFIQMNLLNVSGSNELSGTLKEAYQIISSLETICFLIESKSLREDKYQEMFDKNVHILNHLGLSFPFSYEQFLSEKNVSMEMGSIHVKAANQWLV